MMKVGNVSNYSISTKVVHGSKCYDPHTGAVSFPIYQSATFRHPALYQTTGYDYSRLQNPTREELENTIANIENGKFGFAFSSGMAAVSTILSLFHPKTISLFPMTFMVVLTDCLRKYTKNTVWNFPMSTQAGFRT